MIVFRRTARSLSVVLLKEKSYQWRAFEFLCNISCSDRFFFYFYFFIFFLRDFIFKKTLFEKLQYLKQEQTI